MSSISKADTWLKELPPNTWLKNIPTDAWGRIIDFGSRNDHYLLTRVSKQMCALVRNADSFSLAKAPMITFQNDEPFWVFCYDANTRTIVTSDREYLHGNNPMRLWSCSGELLAEFVHINYKPVSWMSINHLKNELTLISYGWIRTLDLQTRMEKFVSKKIFGRFTYLADSENVNNMKGIDPKQLSNFFPGCRKEELMWTFKDERINRIFTATRRTDVIKFWDAQSHKRITRITQVHLIDATIYDHASSEMICARKEKVLMILDGKEGRVKGKFTVNDPATKLTAFDNCSKTGKLVAAYQQQKNAHRIDGVKIVVWDRKTVQIIASFSPIDPQSRNFYPIQSLHIDDRTNTALTGGCGVQLWDLNSGQMIRKLTQRGWNPIVHWDRDQNKVIVFQRYMSNVDEDDGKLKILNYGHIQPATI